MQLPQQIGSLFPSFTTPLGDALAPLPSPPLPWSLSSSTTQISIDNLSHPLEDVAVTLDVDSVAISEEGSVIVLADAVASESDVVFLASESQTVTQSDAPNLTRATGLGQGQIFSQVVGEFQVEAQENFFFDFAGLLSLESFLEFPYTDSSTTISSISLLLIDNFSHDLVYEFSVFSRINLSRGAQEITVQAVETGGSALNNFQSRFFFNGETSRIDISFEGSFQQQFEDDTQLTLATLTQSQSRIQAPQPASLCPAFLGFDNDETADDLLERYGEIDNERFQPEEHEMLVGGEMDQDELIASSGFDPVKDLKKGFDPIELPNSLICGRSSLPKFCLDKTPTFDQEDILAELFGKTAAEGGDFVSAPSMVTV